MAIVPGRKYIDERNTDIVIWLTERIQILFREGFERGYGDGFSGHFEYGYTTRILNMHISESGKILLVAAY